mmetsp:Transcript_24834/g.67508  ORF Transcript_24834/g.67508 Transcript_24834/m.67508 type:complete len:333 (+) Transcript_24834:521-1519(+)
MQWPTPRPHSQSSLSTPRHCCAGRTHTLRLGPSRRLGRTRKQCWRLSPAVLRPRSNSRRWLVWRRQRQPSLASPGRPPPRQTASSPRPLEEELAQGLRIPMRRRMRARAKRGGLRHPPPQVRTTVQQSRAPLRGVRHERQGWQTASPLCQLRRRRRQKRMRGRRSGLRMRTQRQGPTTPRRHTALPRMELSRRRRSLGSRRLVRARRRTSLMRWRQERKCRPWTWTRPSTERASSRLPGMSPSPMVSTRSPSPALGRRLMFWTRSARPRSERARLSLRRRCASACSSTGLPRTSPSGRQARLRRRRKQRWPCGQAHTRPSSAARRRVPWAGT